MRTSRIFRRSITALASAALIAGVAAVATTAPAAALTGPGRICSEILTAGPGTAPGTVSVTFTVTNAPYNVMAFDTEVGKVVRKFEPIASTPGDPSGTVLAGLEPSTEYWIYVESLGVTRASPCLSRGVKAMSGAVPVPVPAGTDLWMQSYGRLQPTDPCDAGWWASYGQWMHAGLGGWTCDRYVPKYG